MPYTQAKVYANLFRIWMRVEGQECQHFLVGGFIPFTELDYPIQYEDFAITRTGKMYAVTFLIQSMTCIYFILIL